MVGEGSRTDFSSAGSDATLVNDRCPLPLVLTRGGRRVEKQAG